MPARRRRTVKRLKKTSAEKFNFRFVFVFLIGLSVLFYFIKQPRFWSSSEKTSLVIQKDDGDVVVVVFDPLRNEIVSITIPKDTQVEVAKQKGQWRLKSVWQLGENESMGGGLLAETVDKYFRFPVVAWADSSAEIFLKPTVFGLIKVVTTPFATNLNFKDKLELAKFSYTVDNVNRVDINLGNTNYLRKKTLIDDQEGYVKNGKIPQNLAIIFQEPEIAESNLKVTIRDMSETPGFSEEVGELIEALGAKVSAIDKMNDKNGDCRISSEIELYRQVFSRALYCSNVDDKPKGNSDVEITITKNYKKSY